MNEIQSGALVLVIIGLCQALKVAGVKSRWIPLISIVLGILGAIFLGGTSWLVALSGILSALVSSGIWSGVKATIGK